MYHSLNAAEVERPDQPFDEFPEFLEALRAFESTFPKPGPDRYVQRCHQCTAEAAHIRRVLLYRLRWLLFGDLNDIEIADRAGQHKAERGSPFFSHPITEESLGERPIYRVTVYV